MATLGISPYKETSSFLNEAGVPASFIAIDGVICLASMPYWGCKADEMEIKIVDASYPPPENWNGQVILDKKLPRGDENRGKWYIYSYDAVIEDRWSGKPHFDLGPSDYVTNLGLERAWSDPKSCAYQGNILSLLDLYRLRHLDFCRDLWNMVTLQVSVVTEDNYFLLFQRSDSVRYFKRHWSASFEEHMQRKITGGENRQTDYSFVECVERGLNEELGLPKEEIKNSTIRITALARAALSEDMNIHILAFVKLPNYTYRKVDNSRRAARSGGEHLDIDAIPFNPSSIAKILLQGDKYIPIRTGSAPNFFQPSSRMRMLFSSFYYYGTEETLQALWDAKKLL